MVASTSLLAYPDLFSPAELGSFLLFSGVMSAVMYGMIWTLDRYLSGSGNGAYDKKVMDNFIQEGPPAKPSKSILTLLSHFVHLRVEDLDKTNGELEKDVEVLQANIETMRLFIKAEKDGAALDEKIVEQIRAIGYEDGTPLEELEDFLTKCLEECGDIYKEMIRNEQEMQFLLEERAKMAAD